MIKKMNSCIGVCALLACSAVIAQSSIVIGMSLPLTGPQAGAGRDIRTSTEAYVQMVNKEGGINGKKLVLKVMDDEFKPEKTVANIKALVDTDNAIGIASLLGGPQILAAKPVAYSLGLPIVGVLNGNTAVVSAENSSIVHVRQPFSKELQLIVRQYTTIGMKRFAIFSPDDAPGKAAAKTVKDALAISNLTLAAEVGFDRATKDFKPYVDQVSKAAPEVLIVFAPTRAATELIGGLKAAGVSSQIACVSVVDERDLYATLKEKAIGILFSSVVPNPYSINLALTRDYQKAMKEKGETELSLASYEAFINVKVLAEGLRKAGNNPTRASLSKALSDLAPTDLGDVYFRPKADDKNPAGIYVSDIVMLSRNGRLIR